MRVNHVNIVVVDMERSLAFYVGLLGMRITFEVDLEGEWIETVAGLSGVQARCVFVQPDGGGTRFELLKYLNPPGVSLPQNAIANTGGLRHIALEVEEVDSLYARLKEAGVEAVSPPVTVPFAIVEGLRKRLCYLRDPDGVLVEIASYIREDQDQGL